MNSGTRTSTASDRHASSGGNDRTTRRRTGRLLPFLLLLVALAPHALSQPIAFQHLNTSDDDYAAAFRTTTGGTEIWYTTSNGFGERRSRRLMRARIEGNRLSDPEPLPYPINTLPLDRNGVLMDGSPTFAFCENARGIFVSNRTVDGRYFENDLYEMTDKGNGNWDIQRIDAVDSASWDDTPALSEDGRQLYFSSDRRAPGSLRTDIYLSTLRPDGSWSAPVALDQINTTDYAEQTPYVGNDGYLYYATNQTREGDYDIWRVQLDPETGKPIGSPGPIDIPGVNASGSDEGHPLFSPGGGWFLFSSNRGPNGVKDFDIYSVRLPERHDTIYLSVQLRTRRAGEDKTDPIGTVIRMTDPATGSTSSLRSNEAGDCTIPIIRPTEENPSADRRFLEMIVTAESPLPGYVASTDTLLIDLLCARRLAHTLYLWDTTALRADSCIQDFRIKNVRFFVTGYWCPTTRLFAEYAPCTSVLPDSICTTIEYQQPQLSCASDDIYTYNLKFTPPEVVRSRQPLSNCIDLREVADPKTRDFRAREVDSAIVKLVDAMRSALEYDCVQRAVRDGKPVTVNVIGWTDPRPLDRSCAYTGPDIDLNASFVQLDIEDSPYIQGNILHNGTRFRESREGGNQLLSQLRAYYTARLLDAVWEERVEDYRRLKGAGLLRVEAIGRAISQEQVPMEQQRSVSVLVSVPMEEMPQQAATLPSPGRYRQLCDPPCR